MKQFPQKNSNLNKSGISATSGIQFTQSNYNSNARYYQDQADSFALDKNNRNTLSSQNNLMNNTMVSQGSNQQAGSMRPITRDVKLRSQAANRNTQLPNGTRGQNSGSMQHLNENSPTHQNTGISATGGISGRKTFQNTINIGNFINEINKQKEDVQIHQNNAKTFSNTIDGTEDSSVHRNKHNEPIRRDSMGERTS